MAAITSLDSDLHEYQTIAIAIAIDSLDWLERMIWDQVVRERGPGSKTAVGG